MNEAAHFRALNKEQKIEVHHSFSATTATTTTPTDYLNTQGLTCNCVIPPYTVQHQQILKYPIINPYAKTMTMSNPYAQTIFNKF